MEPLLALSSWMQIERSIWMEVTIKNINLYIELQIKDAWTGNMMEDSEIEQRLNELTLRLNGLSNKYVLP